MHSRRTVGKRLLAGIAVPLFGPIASDVHLGVHTRSFRDLRQPGVDEVDTVIRALTECGARDCEIFAPQVEARYGDSHASHSGSKAVMSPQMMRRELRKWRLRTSVTYFRAIGEKFKAAGIAVYAFDYSPDTTFTNEEIDRGFGMAKALGAEIVTAATTLEIAKRMVPFAEQHRMVVALRGTANTSHAPGCATPDQLAAWAKLSRYCKITLSLGDVTACGSDAIAYLREHHADITDLHLADRRKGQTDSVPFGQGDARIREALQLVKQEAWPIRASVVYDYRGQGSPVDEVKACLAYAKQALA